QIADGGDVEGSVALAVEESETTINRIALRWCGPDADDTQLVSDLRQVRPGDTLILPTAAGGWEIFGHIPEDQDSENFQLRLAAQASQCPRDVAVLRVNPLVGKDWPRECQIDGLRQIWTNPALEEDQDALNDLLDEILSALAPLPTAPPWLHDAA